MKKILLILLVFFVTGMQCLAADAGAGVGLKVWKPYGYKMSLMITGYDLGSPADKAKLSSNLLIIKIDNIPTTNLGIDECIKILNDPSKKTIELYVTDLNRDNQKIVKLKPQKWFSSERGYYGIKRAILKENIIFPELVRSNSMEELLSGYFKTLAPDYRLGEYTQKEGQDIDWKVINDEYLKFKKNKDDMSNNWRLYSGAKEFSENYAEMKSWEYNNVINIINEYSVNTAKSIMKEDDLQAVLKYKNVANLELFINSQRAGADYSQKYAAIAKEIYDYSLAYEKNKQAQQKVSSPYFVDNIDFRSVLWSGYTPKKNGLYAITSSCGMKVLQSVNGGILVRSDFFSSDVVMFIGTKRQFSDGTYIQNPICVVFEGFYSYQNTLGAARKVYKFREVSQEEYKRLALPPKYYFLNE